VSISKYTRLCYENSKINAGKLSLKKISSSCVGKIELQSSNVRSSSPWTAIPSRWSSILCNVAMVVVFMVTQLPRECALSVTRIPSAKSRCLPWIWTGEKWIIDIRCHFIQVLLLCSSSTGPTQHSIVASEPSSSTTTSILPVILKEEVVYAHFRD